MRLAGSPALVILSMTWILHAAAEPGNLVRDGDFERAGLQLTKSAEPGQWAVFIHGRSDAALAIVERAGRDGSRGVRYTKTAAGNQNIHLDQIVRVRPGSIYQLRAWVRADSRLDPVLSVTDMKWKPLITIVSHAGRQWTEVRAVFASAESDRVRVEWFPGALGKLYQGVAGTSWLDEVRLTEMTAPPATLKQAFELAESKKEEIDLAAVRAEPPVSPRPLRPIRCRDGVLVYADGGEVALWGVNLQTALSWEYNVRMRNCGVPLTAAALKSIADTNLLELQRMGATVIRMHLLPCDFSDAKGNIRDSIFLDVLDYTLARCREAGIYVYLTLVNAMGQWHYPDAFLAGREREEWLVDEDLVRKTERYIQAFLSRENRYTHQLYSGDPTVAVIEVMNEPRYVSYAAMENEARFADLRSRFEAWCRQRGVTDYLQQHYRVFRYQLVRDYIDRMAQAIRSTGTQQPVAWNLNWPRMIRDHEDVFQAAADSTVDVVSFCCYPGQSDVPSPFWKHPRDLSDNNYLPFLRANYRDYDRLRWLLTRRFAGKAKAVYEFETFYNQTSYLYPAMARLFRALGAQVAQMWTYSLTPTAEYMQGSHHLNLYCTPQKAISFLIAGHVFQHTHRYAPYPEGDDETLTFDGCTVSFPQRTSALSRPERLIYSGPVDWSAIEVSSSVREMAGVGDSPLVSYGGSGAYFLHLADDAIDITIHPDATFLLPPWDKQKTRPWKRVCALDSRAEHPFALRLPGWGEGYRVFRIEDGQRTRVRIQREGDTITFTAHAGQYQARRR